MSKIATIHGPIGFTRDGVVAFSGITSVLPATLGTRVGIGFSEIVGYAIVTAAAPGVAAGSLIIEQSATAVNFDFATTFAMTLALGVQPFDIKIVGSLIRARFTVPVGETYDIRFWAHLNPIASL